MTPSIIFAYRAGDLMQDLKTGHLIGASPRAQFYAQLLGSALSVLVTASAYSLYQRAYPIPGPNFPAPTAYVWLGLARLLRERLHNNVSKSFNQGFVDKAMGNFQIRAAYSCWSSHCLRLLTPRSRF